MDAHTACTCATAVNGSLVVVNCYNITVVKHGNSGSMNLTSIIIIILIIIIIIIIIIINRNTIISSISSMYNNILL